MALGSGLHPSSQMRTGNRRCRKAFVFSTMAVFLAAAPIKIAVAQASFGKVQVGDRLTQTVPISFSNPGTLGKIAVVTQGVTDLDFRYTSGGNCRVGTAYPNGAACTVDVTFKPRSTGTRYGALVLWSTKGDSLGAVYLNGTGAGPLTVFLPGQHVAIDHGYIYVAGVAVDEGGGLYVVDAGDLWIEGGTTPGTVYRETRLPNGRYSRNAIGKGLLAPWTIAVDGAGDLYIADIMQSVIIKEALQADGSYLQSTIGSDFLSPSGVAVDSAGNVYVADNGYLYQGGAVYKETLTDGEYVQSTIGKGWGTPSGVAVDVVGNVYVADRGLPLLNGDMPSTVRKEKPAKGGYAQSYIGLHWWGASAIALDGNGSVYVVDYPIGTVFRETPLNGSYVESVVRQVVGDQLTLILSGVAVDSFRNVYTTDSLNTANTVTAEECGSPPSLEFPMAAYRDTQGAVPQTVTVSNLGNDDLGIASVAFPPDFPQQPSTSPACKPNMLLAANESCTLTTEFKPAEPLGSAASRKLQEDVTITTDTLNREDTRQKVSLSGDEVPITATPVFSPRSGTIFKTPGTVTITDSTRGAKIYYAEGGGDPVIGLVPYTGPIKFECGKCTLKAIAIAPGHVQSGIATATYFYEGPYSKKTRAIGQN